MRNAILGRTHGLALALAMAAGVPAVAEDAARTWSGSATLYAWLPALEGSATIPGSGLNGDFSAGISDVLEALNFGAFGTVSLNYGEFGVLADLQYSNISSEATLGGPLGRTVKNGTKLTIFTLAGTYRVIDEDARYLDILAGARFVSADISLATTRTLPAPVTRSASAGDSFVDPIVGLRGGLPLSERWSVHAILDVGGFGVGSDFSWEAYLGASYVLSAGLVADLGFRYLSIDRNADRVDYDLQMFGPVAGITYRF